MVGVDSAFNDLTTPLGSVTSHCAYSGDCDIAQAPKEPPGCRIGGETFPRTPLLVTESPTVIWRRPRGINSYLISCSAPQWKAGISTASTTVRVTATWKKFGASTKVDNDDDDGLHNTFSWAPRTLFLSRSEKIPGIMGRMVFCVSSVCAAPSVVTSPLGASLSPLAV